jgi:hypothetical protein
MTHVLISWDACGCNLPVAIHISDPIALMPTDRFNERYEELNNHPDWSFQGGDFSNDELIAARNRVIARPEDTIFGVVRETSRKTCVGDFDRYSTCSSISRRASEPARHGRKFSTISGLDLFATDATPHEDVLQVFNDKLYEIYFRFLETEDEYFDYAPAKIPPQGRWRIYGIGLPETILKKVYYENSARILRI